MRMTKCAKEHVIDRIMNDVPKVKYMAQAESLFREVCYSLMPEAIVKIAKDASLQYRLQTGYPCIFSNGGYSGLRIQIAVRGWEEGENGDKKKLRDCPELDAVIELAKKADIQQKARTAMREDLNAMFARVNTRKQFEERFPEFVRYLPTPPVASTDQLPADPAIFTKLIAMGWKAE